MLQSQQSHRAAVFIQIGRQVPKNVVKLKARPRRLFSKTGDDQLGLWIDLDLLRRQHKRPAQTIIHDPLSSVNNRYLQLADVALGKAKFRKKSKGAAG